MGDTTKSRGRLMLTVLGGLAEFERPYAHRRRPRAGQGARCEAGPQAKADRPSAAGGNQAPRSGRRTDPRHCPQLQRPLQHDFPVVDLKSYVSRKYSLRLMLVAGEMDWPVHDAAKSAPGYHSKIQIALCLPRSKVKVREQFASLIIKEEWVRPRSWQILGLN
jgi:hypothetical protein